MKATRGKPDQDRAAALCERLRAFDLGLMELVEAAQDSLTLRTAGELVAMHRKLRRLRFQIEAEAGI